MATAILVLNILLPGSGTMLYGRIARGVALLLLALPLLLIPWILSIVDGVRIMTRAMERGPPRPVPAEAASGESPPAPQPVTEEPELAAPKGPRKKASRKRT